MSRWTGPAFVGGGEETGWDRIRGFRACGACGEVCLASLGVGLGS